MGYFLQKRILGIAKSKLLKEKRIAIILGCKMVKDNFLPFLKKGNLHDETKN